MVMVPSYPFDSAFPHIHLRQSRYVLIEERGIGPMSRHNRLYINICESSLESPRFQEDCGVKNVFGSRSECLDSAFSELSLANADSMRIRRFRPS